MQGQPSGEHEETSKGLCVPTQQRAPREGSSHAKKSAQITSLTKQIQLKAENKHHVYPYIIHQHTHESK
jgi:hypothetical protein